MIKEKSWKHFQGFCIMILSADFSECIFTADELMLLTQAKAEKNSKRNSTQDSRQICYKKYVLDFFPPILPSCPLSTYHPCQPVTHTNNT